MPSTPLEELPQRLAVLRAQAERAPRSYAERREDLYDLRAALKLNLPELVRAMAADFGCRIHFFRLAIRWSISDSTVMPSETRLSWRLRQPKSAIARVNTATTSLSVVCVSYA